MSADAGNADLPDELAPMFDPEFVTADDSDPELLAEVQEKIVEAWKLTNRAGIRRPRDRDEHGEPFPRLEMDNPPAASEDPLLQMGYTVLPQLPEHWEYVWLEVTAAADDVRTTAMVHMQGENVPLEGIRFFSDLAEPSLALRRSKYGPDGRGAWYNVMIKLDHDGMMKPIYDFDRPPFGCWGPNEVALVLRDQELYPRDPARLPDWHPAADPESADLSDGPGDMFDPAGVPDGVAEAQQKITEVWKLLERAGAKPPPDKDEHGGPLPRLDMDNPPAAAEDPLLQIGYAMLPQLPDRWETVYLDIEAAADEVRSFAMVRMQESDVPFDSRYRFFADITAPSLALRQSTYEPDGRGAWYGARIRLFRDGTIDATYDFIRPPFGYWGPNEVALVLRDHELYPRDPGQLPPWHPAR